MNMDYIFATNHTSKKWVQHKKALNVLMIANEKYKIILKSIKNICL